MSYTLAARKEVYVVTANQIAYWNYEESKRSNRARENETHRANVAKETENIRSNLARETETQRSNLVNEREHNRSNLAKEAENYRSNTAQEALKDEANRIQKTNVIWGNINKSLGVGTELAKQIASIIAAGKAS